MPYYIAQIEVQIFMPDRLSAEEWTEHRAHAIATDADTVGGTQDWNVLDSDREDA